MEEKSIDQKRSNFVNYMANPKSFTLKQWFVGLLKEDYAPHDQIIERIAVSITTDKDLKDFGKLVTTVYEKAYHKAVNDYKEQAEKLGIKITITAGEEESN